MIQRIFCMMLLGQATVSLAVEPSRPTPDQLKFFENKVRPLLSQHCFKCHGPKKQQGKLRLDARANLITGGESGPSIVPGKPTDSLLIDAVNYGSLEMPPSGKLSPKEIDILHRWIQMGAPWPGDTKVRHQVNGKTFEITAEDRAFWSFQPLVKPTIAVSKDPWKQQPIDAFISRKLHQTGLTPSPPATRRELIRRLYIDLIGLPPTPKEVAAFVANQSPDAYEALIDQLLARPQYGERWGRHWLDLVRYAETNGYERDDGKPNAWRYRDYVIRAFNEDKPYDRFILEQLAGDELPDMTLDSVIATGFYRIGVWDDEPDDKTLARWDELDDILRTTGETFLGLTIGCARCHEHKFDPIPQEDYYRLVSFFRNVQPYGKDQSSTHWELNPAAVYTPLATPKQFAEYQVDKEKWQGQVEELKKQVETIGKDQAEEKKKLEEEIKQLQERLKNPFPQALSVREAGPSPPKTHLLVRGSPLTKGQPVEPGFLSVLQQPASAPSLTKVVTTNPQRKVLEELGVKPTSGRRRALAQWIASKQNPLTARVMVNRIWHYHFGQGLVPTASDFGSTGQLPSHPELLDWLASELIDGGWRLKQLHKKILLSKTYQQSSRINNQAAVKIDPGNRLLWRQNLRRLEAEVIRDSILAVNGRLNLKAGGASIFPELSKEVLATQSRPGRGWNQSSQEEQARRSVYIYIKRTLTVPLLDSFDQPTPDQPTPLRATTTIAPQALILLNSHFMDKNATAFAERLVKEAGPEARRQVALAYNLALLRQPDKREEEIALRFLEEQQKEFASLDPDTPKATEKRALVAMCRLLFNLNEFVYLD